MAKRSMAGASISDRAASSQIGVLSELWRFASPYLTLLCSSVCALVLTATLSLVLPLAVRRVVDNFSAEDGILLNYYFMASIVIAGLLAIGTGLRYALVTKLGERVVADIRKAVFEHVLRMSPVFFERIMTGEILSRVTTDTTLIQSVVGSSISIALRNALIFIGGLIMMLVTSAKLTMMVLLLVPLILVPILSLSRKLRRLSRENQDWIAASSGKASEALNHVQTVQAFTNENAASSGFADVTEQSYVSAMRRIKTRALMTVFVIFLIFTGIVCVLWIGALDVRLERMSAGTLIQFVIYSVLVGGSAAALSEIWGELQRAAGATERIVELLQAEDNILDPDKPAPLPSPTRGEIWFDSVDFAYPSRPYIPALRKFNLKIRQGETIALVGPSGAGKSTVVQMIQRFYDPDNGRILLDGLEIDGFARKDLRSAIAVVPQDPVIFADTIRENIRFGRMDATDAEIIDSTKSAAAHEFIIDLSDGYDTYVGERGVLLSGGQRQRIAIARAILRDAPILLLDEATSSLDAESEQAVRMAVERMSRSRTTVIVAHRLATVKKADRIIVMDNGGIVASGNHKSLIAENGLYARFAKLQFTDDVAA
ncbi:MAG: ABC transporter transmembrane domain-containing protein [Roseovarius sp.]|nr:ABC transporter transmembrane domain-containing protein [Roseovarius sp.]MCY4290472.1 ABC transporter transmembrane domain-containing protein [Roseovarius sp.]MCY4315508.1 ABC transporter transmembrane domain-containing protein [Roseovarius sp.]